MDNSILGMHPYRLLQWILVWYCIFHVTLVVVLYGLKFIRGRIRAFREKTAPPPKS